MINQETISRKNFLLTLGIGGSALMAILQSCTNSTVAPIAPTGTVDLTSSLLKIGDFIYSGNAIVVIIAEGNAASSFVAVSKACTHEGSTIRYTGNNTFNCPNHGAQFNTSGSVTRGPANRSLTIYSVKVTGSMISLA